MRSVWKRTRIRKHAITSTALDSFFDPNTQQLKLALIASLAVPVARWGEGFLFYS
jgi:hypothetical protein